MFKTFQYKTHGIERLSFIYGQKLYRALVNKNCNFFLKPTDIISHRPTLAGYHEAHLESFFRQAAQTHQDFFLDIGANIGLTSGLVGDQFTYVDCVEPNELVLNILKTNLALNLTKARLSIHHLALAKEAGDLSLTVPLDNFGGAYIAQDNPQFASGQHAFSEQQKVFTTSVRAENAEVWLKAKFQDYQEKKLSKGVIKIDVEGYDQFILQSIFNTLPEQLSVIIVLENWFKYFPVSDFTSSHRLSWFHFKKQLNLWHSIVSKLLGGHSTYAYKMVPLTDETYKPRDCCVYCD